MSLSVFCWVTACVESVDLCVIECVNFVVECVLFG